MKMLKEIEYLFWIKPEEQYKQDKKEEELLCLYGFLRPTIKQNLCNCKIHLESYDSSLLDENTSENNYPNPLANSSFQKDSELVSSCDWVENLINQADPIKPRKQIFNSNGKSRNKISQKQIIRKSMRNSPKLINYPFHWEEDEMLRVKFPRFLKYPNFKTR